MAGATAEGVLATWTEQVDASCIVAENIYVPLEAVHIDVTGTHGQIRMLDSQTVESRLANIQQSPPNVPTQVILVQQDPAGMIHLPRDRALHFICICAGKSFWVIGGQHTVAATIKLRQMRLEAGYDVSAPWMNEVHAVKVVRFGTPVGVVQLLAGDHQCTQSGVVNRSIAQFLRMVVSEPFDTASPDAHSAWAAEMWVAEGFQSGMQSITTFCMMYTYLVFHYRTKN